MTKLRKGERIVCGIFFSSHFDDMCMYLRGRSKLSTFINAYRAYPRWREGSEIHCILFSRKSTFNVDHCQCVHFVSSLLKSTNRIDLNMT